MEHSHTQVDYEQALSDIAKERAAHARTKATLDTEVLLRTEVEVSRECTQHWNEMQAELIHSLKSELNDSRTSHDDMGNEIRRSNGIAFVQDQWMKSWVHKLREHIFSLGYEPVAPPSSPVIPDI